MAEPGQRALLSGRYEVRDRIASGGMGSIFEAEDTDLCRPVAVKLLAPTAGPENRRFLREARTLSRLNHPAIVRLFDAGADGGHPYLVMELVRGPSLRERLREGPLDPAEVRHLGASLAGALAHAHEAGVVHRDVKPANVLLDEEGGVRLADFGIADLADMAEDDTADAFGTPAYVAPEQVAGDEVTSAVDVYALGLLLLECLTGRRPFPGTPVEAGMARLHRAPHIPDDLPDELRTLLEAMTAREPACRPEAAEVARQLHPRQAATPAEVERPHDRGHSRPSLTAPLPAPEPTLALTGSQPEPSARKSVSRPVVWAVIALIGLAVALAARDVVGGTRGAVIDAPPAAVEEVAPEPAPAPAQDEAAPREREAPQGSANGQDPGGGPPPQAPAHGRRG